MNVCSLGAINMEYDLLGKTIPKINFDKCCNCGLCLKTCPINNEPYYNAIKRCYAVSIINQDDYITCASGGAATGFGKYIIEQGGLVVGTRFNEQMDLVFKIADNKNELETFKGSKYVQAYMGTIFSDIKRELKNEKTVLFIGTPCQVDGLLNYLKKRYQNLITMDIVCHGTPPIKYLKEYINDDDVDNITFRYMNSWDFIKWKNKVIKYKSSYTKDYYFQAFLNSLIYRDNCYHCVYAQEKRVSDLTIGDFWGLDRTKLKNNLPGKVSVVMINSEIGERLFENAKSLFNFEERPISEGIDGNAQLRRPSIPFKDRKKFESQYMKKGFIKSVKETSIKRIVYSNVIRSILVYPLNLIIRQLSKMNFYK